MLLDDIDSHLRLRLCWPDGDSLLLGGSMELFGGSGFITIGLEVGLEDIGKYLCFSSSK